MKMKKVIRITGIILGIVLIIVGCYHILTGLGVLNRSTTSSSSVSTVMIGETVTDKDGVEFCVVKVDNVKSVGDGYLQAETDNNFVQLSIKITNKSNEPYDVNALRFLLVEGENEYQYDTNAVFSVENFMTMDTINPNISKEYVIIYETPTTTLEQEYKLKILPIGLSEKESVFITLREDES